ncbi:DUF4031 domain-containing protein [Luteococcus peritonei]|uniref:DUF4031 domain-containing protein n=1 Tax=Luteococcus peritonei TaxID=88874 RepID=A0ABW4RVL7_9ACTN
MALLVDSPRWPAHGTVYGHLVSDHSLWELHAGAARAGLSTRAFDHDHYDLAAERFDDALAAGAVRVDERELVHRLRSGGLRILPADHAPRRGRARAALHRRFEHLLPAAALHQVVQDYSGPGRWYHDVRHLVEMLGHLDRLAALEGVVPTPAEELAVLFHDVVYDGIAGQDEQLSAERAVSTLRQAGHEEDVVAEVERLVLLTAHHRPDPADRSGARVSDADMAILASVPGRYHVSVRDIHLEYAHLAADRWRQGRAAVLQGFLSGGEIFVTEHGRRVWEQRARRNVADELEHLQAGQLL